MASPKNKITLREKEEKKNECPTRIADGAMNLNDIFNHLVKYLLTDPLQLPNILETNVQTS